MEAVLQAAMEGFTTVFSWPNMIYPIVGTLLAMVVSALPGISGVALMAIVLPFTLSWDPLQVVLLYGALLGGATYMGSVTAILLNVPGRNSNVATMWDGHPLARQGKANTALGCSAAASALGSTFGIVVLLAVLPWLREWVLLFGPAEYLVATIGGLLIIATVARGSPVKGLIMAGLGFMIAFIGSDPRTAEPRYTFGSLELADGLDLASVFLGLFALAEMIGLVVSGRKTISDAVRIDQLTGSIVEGIKAVPRHFGLFLRSSAIGTLIGMLPGVGGTVASFVAYGSAAQARDGRFGDGDIRGVLAPEAANDAKDGGALIPTLAFGIPGGTGTAMLLAVFMTHGLSPGPDLMINQLDLVFALIWSLFLSNWLTSLLGLAVAPRMTALTVIRIHRLVPVIVVAVVVAAYVSEGRLFGIWVAMVFGVMGYYLKKYDWPRIPFVIALVLAPLFETNLHLALQLQALGRIDFWSRPLVLILTFLVIATVTIPAVISLQKRPWKKE